MSVLAVMPVRKKFVRRLGLLTIVYGFVCIGFWLLSVDFGDYLPVSLRSVFSPLLIWVGMICLWSGLCALVKSESLS